MISLFGFRAFVLANLQVGSWVSPLGAAPLVFKGEGLNPTALPIWVQRPLP